MQGITKWRMSFSSPRSYKQLKKLWTDYVQLKRGDEYDISTARSLFQFLESMLTLPDQLNQTSIMEEFAQDLLEIIPSLLVSLRTYSDKAIKPNTGSEDASLISEIIFKSLTLMELLVTTKNSKSVFKDAKENQCIRLSLEALKSARGIPTYLSLLRIMKHLVCTENHLIEFISCHGFEQLSELVSRENQPSLTSQVMQFFKTFSEHCLTNASIENTGQFSPKPATRHRNHSVSSSGTAASNAIPQSRLTQALAAADAHEESIAAKGFNLAVNVVTEILKFSPLASTWLNPESENKDKTVSNPLVNVNEELIYLSSYPLSSLSIGTENTRINNLLRPVKRDLSRRRTISREVTAELSPSKLGAIRVDKPVGAARAPAYSCDTEDTDDAPSEDPDSPGEVQMRDQMRQQGMSSIVMLCMEQARSPTDVIDAITGLESMLLKRPAAQYEFASSNGFSKFQEMLLRTEENLVLLVSCSDVSLAVASGSRQAKLSVDIPIAQGTPPGAEQVKKSLYFSSVGASGDFDTYYSTLVMVILNILLDEPSCTLVQNIHLRPVLPRRGLTIGNLPALSMLVNLLHCGQITLVMVAVKICFALLRTSSTNVIALETVGVVAALMEVLTSIVFGCSLDVNSLLLRDRVESPNNGRSHETGLSFDETKCQVNKNLVSLAADILVVLQMVSVATAHRDESIVSFLTLLTAMLSMPQYDIERSQHGMLCKCLNCETESATLECLHDGCVCEKMFRLCDECDKVFHKSAVKRAHIRVPIMNIPVPAVDLNSNMTGFDAKVNSLKKHGLSVNTSFALLWESLNSTSLAAFKTCGIAPGQCVALNMIDFESDASIFKESVSSLLLSSIRGLLDDRKARGLPLPCEIFPALLVTLRRTMVDPFQSWGVNDAKLCSSELADLTDYRDDLLSPGSEIFNKQNKQNDQYQQPPEINHSSPRRIRLSLALQCVARFVVADVLQNAMSTSHESQSNGLARESSVSIVGKQLLSCIDLIKSFGVDGLLMHALIDTSTQFTHLTVVDKQFIVWLTRECVVSALKLKPDRATRFLQWFLWILRSEVTQTVNTKFKTNRPDMKGFSHRHGSKTTADKYSGRSSSGLHPTHSNSYTEYVELPSTNPKISHLIRLLIHQELRYLMAGDDRHASKKSTLNGQVLPSACNVLSTPFATSSSDSYTSRSNSFENDSSHSTRVPSYARETSQSQLKTLNQYSTMCNVPATCNSVKVMLTQLGFVELLSEMVMGDMCSRLITELLDSRGKPCGSGVLLSDLDREDWWGALATLGQLLTCCEPAKDVLDSYIGSQKFIAFLIPLIKYVSSNPSHSQMHLINYKAILTGICVEVCVTSGTFSAPTRPYAMTVPKFPASVPGNIQVKSLREPSPRLTRKSFNKFDFADALTPSASGDLSVLFMRLGIMNIRPCNEPADITVAGDAFTTLTPSCSVAGAVGLCPVYYSHEGAVRLITATIKSYPLTMTSESLKSSFVNASGSLTNVNTALWPPSSASKSGARVLNRPSGSFTGKPPLLQQPGHDFSENSSAQARKLMIMRNVSNASVHSLEIGDRWELDSTSGHGEGRASFHSHQSLLTLAQALRSGGAGANTPPQSVNGDSASVLGTYLKSLKPGDDMDYSTHYSVDHKGKLCDPQLDSESSEYPFPPMIGNQVASTPLIYFSFLRSLNNGLSHYAANVLILLHHALLVRSGISDDIGDEEDFVDDRRFVGSENSPVNESKSHAAARSSLKDSSARDLEVVAAVAASTAIKNNGSQYRQILRKHLSMLLPPSYHYHEWKTNCDAWKPPFTRLQIRNVGCGELLVALALIMPEDTQNFLVTSLSSMLDGNPANAFQFVGHSNGSCLSLTKLISSLPAGLSETLGYVVSQILRYSVEVAPLDELINSVSRDSQAAMVLAKSAASAVEIFESVSDTHDDPYYRNLLFVLGRTAERVCPTSFLHFDLRSPFDGRIELPSVTLPARQITLSCWVRLGTMSDSAVASFTQLSSPDNKCLIDVYFRAVHKLFPIMGDRREESAKKTVQLCLSFGKAVQNTVIDAAASGPASESTGLDIDGAFATDQSYWNLAVDQLLGLADDSIDFKGSGASIQSSDDITDQTIKGALSTIASAIAHFSVPDVIVEFDWSELGDWHLLNLIISDAGIVCSVDWARVPVLYWSPFGYKYDQASLKMKVNKAVVIPVSSLETSTSMKEKKSESHSDESADTLICTSLTRDSLLKIAVGGLLHESNAYDVVTKHIYSSMNQAFYNSSSTQSALLESSSQRAACLLSAFESLISGFSGSIGEIALFDGILDDLQLSKCYREGPAHGLRELKFNRLTALVTSGMPHPVTHAAVTDSKAVVPAPSALQFPLMRAASPPPLGASSPPTVPSETYNDRSLNIFGSHYVFGMTVRDELMNRRSLKDKDSFVKFSEEVQIHHTAGTPSAIAALGGLKVLFPLMISDRGRLLAALRVMGCIVTTSVEQYEDFKSNHIDKAIFYCCKIHPKLVTLETLQVLFELVSFSSGYGSFGSAVQNSSDSDKIIRTSILELVVDIVSSCPGDFQLARSVVDWLRETCDDQLENSQKYLKMPNLLLPILLMSSCWLAEGTSDAVSVLKSKTHPLSERKESEGALTESKSRGTAKVRSNSLTASDSESKPFKPIELSRKPPFSGQRLRSQGDEDFSAALQVATMDKFKLQLSCFRLLKLLVSGTGGDISHRTPVSLNQTLTGFSVAQLSSLINFAVSLSSRAPKHSTGSKSIRKYERMRLASQCVGMPHLTQVEFGCEEYWQYMGAVSVLDSFLVLVGGPLEATIINMLRNLNTANTLWLSVLNLMGSPCVEVRQRGIQLLSLSLSTAEGKIDAKQVLAFERMFGFQLMADQLAFHKNGCCDMIIESLFSLLYWSKGGRSASERHASSRKGSKEAIPSFADPAMSDPLSRSNLFGRPGGVDTSVSSLMETARTRSGSFDVAAASKDDMISANRSLSASNILPKAASLPVKAVVASEGSGDKANEKTGEAQVASSLESGSSNNSSELPTGAATGAPATTDGAFFDISTEEKRLSASRESMASFDGRTSSSTGHSPGNSIQISKVLMEIEASKSEDDAGRVASPTRDDNVGEQEIIQVPQALEVLVRVLQNAQSVEQVSSSFSRLEACISLSGDPSIKKDKLKSAVETVNRNSESIFSQKDWLIWLCDALITFRRRMLNFEDLEASSSVFSLSESESIGGGGGGFDVDNSEAESEDSQSTAGVEQSDSFSEDGSDQGAPRFAGTKSRAWQQHMITQFTGPVFNFIHRLLVLDMKAKYSSTRRWNEVLRLSLPETFDVQEAILSDLVETLRSLTMLAEGIEITLQFLRNMGALFEQILEKADLSLGFCMKVVQALHGLSYQCPAEVRSRIKETSLPEIRKNFIIRCLVDNTQMLISKTAVLNGIMLPLQGYLSANESKLLADHQVVTILLGMFVDSLDDLEVALAAINSVTVHSSGSHEKLQMSIEIMRTLIVLIQGCVTSSIECKKSMLRILPDVPGDQTRTLTKVFMNMLDESSSTEASAKSVDVPAVAAVSAPSASSQSSYSWWGWGSSSTSTEQYNATNNEVHVDIESGAQSKEVETEPESPEKILDLNKFIEWLLSPVQSEILKDFKARILKEYKPVLRQAEKLRERFSQRYTRHSRALQDKRQRDKTMLAKSVKESYSAVKTHEEKTISQQQKEIKGWSNALGQKIELGKSVFLGTYVEEKSVLRSPTKDQKSASKTFLTSANYSHVVVPDSLKVFFQASVGSTEVDELNGAVPVATSSMSQTDALHALMDYFSSARAK